MGEDRKSEVNRVASDPVGHGEHSFKARIEKVLSEFRGGNTNEKAYEILMLLEDPEVESFPVLDLMEQAWQILSEYYGDLGGKPIVPRVDHPDKAASSPLENFKHNVEMGFYPPPEVMIVIQRCFQEYLDARGDISLDEAFFGEPYKKRESLAYKRGRGFEYSLFHNFFVNSPQRHQAEADSQKKSLELLAEEYFDYFVGDLAGEFDLQTFLRGYRRWKEERKIKE